MLIFQMKDMVKESSLDDGRKGGGRCRKAGCNYQQARSLL